MDWRILAFSVPALFAIYQSLSKLLPKGTSIFLVSAYASLIGFILMLTLHLFTQPNKSLHLPARSLWLAIGIGLLIGLGNFGIIKAYSLGAPQSLFTILFYITLIVYGVALGVLFWHEKLHIMQLTGAVLACLGLFLIIRFKS